MNTKRHVKRLLSIITYITVFSFLYQDVIWAQGLLGGTARVLTRDNMPVLNRSLSELRISDDIGKVKEIWDTNGKKKIIHIQDSHVNYEAQKNIARILEQVIQIDKKVLVAVEGAEGAIDTRQLSSISHDGIKDIVSNHLMKEGYLTGAEYYSVFYPKMLIWGVEDRDVYLKNLELFKKLYKTKSQAGRMLASVTAKLNSIKSGTFNNDQIIFIDKVSAYHNDDIGLEEYSLFLSEKPEFKENTKYRNLDRLIRLIRYKERINFEMVDSERMKLLKELKNRLKKEELVEVITRGLEYQIGKVSPSEYFGYLGRLLRNYKMVIKQDMAFSNLRKYIKYVKIESQINRDQLFSECRRIEEEIANRSFSSAEHRDLYNKFLQAIILRKFMDFKIYREDLQYYKEHKGEFYKISSRGFENFLDCFEEFCNLGIDRDRILVENTIKKMKESDSDTAILITGGFHTKGIVDLFKDKGISYAVVSPRMVEVQVKKRYISIMLEEKSPLEKVVEFSGTRLATALNWAIEPIKSEFALGTQEYSEALIKGLIPEVYGLAGKQIDVERLKETDPDFRDKLAKLVRNNPDEKPYQEDGIVVIPLLCGKEGNKLYVTMGDKLPETSVECFKEVRLDLRYGATKIIGFYRKNLYPKTRLISGGNGVKRIKDRIPNSSGPFLIMSFSLISLVKRLVKNLKKTERIAQGGSYRKVVPIEVIAQNVEIDARTSELNFYHLKTAGATGMILGHSDVRERLGETDSNVNRKLKDVLEGGFKTIIVCIGEGFNVVLRAAQLYLKARERMLTGSSVKDRSNYEAQYMLEEAMVLGPEGKLSDLIANLLAQLYIYFGEQNSKDSTVALAYYEKADALNPSDSNVRGDIENKLKSIRKKIGVSEIVTIGAIKKRATIEEVMAKIEHAEITDFKNIYKKAYRLYIKKLKTKQLRHLIEKLSIQLADTGKPMLYIGYDTNGKIKDAWGLANLAGKRIVLSKPKVEEYIAKNRMDLLFAYLHHELIEYQQLSSGKSEEEAHEAGRKAELTFAAESKRGTDNVGPRSILQDDFKSTRDNYVLQIKSQIKMPGKEEIREKIIEILKTNPRPSIAKDVLAFIIIRRYGGELDIEVAEDFGKGQEAVNIGNKIKAMVTKVIASEIKNGLVTEVYTHKKEPPYFLMTNRLGDLVRGGEIGFVFGESWGGAAMKRRISPDLEEIGGVYMLGEATEEYLKKGNMIMVEGIKPDFMEEILFFKGKRFNGLVISGKIYKILGNEASARYVTKNRLEDMIANGEVFIGLSSKEKQIYIAREAVTSSENLIYIRDYNINKLLKLIEEKAGVENKIRVENTVKDLLTRKINRKDLPLGLSRVDVDIVDFLIEFSLMVIEFSPPDITKEEIVNMLLATFSLLNLENDKELIEFYNIVELIGTFNNILGQKRREFTKQLSMLYRFRKIVQGFSRPAYIFAFIYIILLVKYLPSTEEWDRGVLSKIGFSILTPLLKRYALMREKRLDNTLYKVAYPTEYKASEERFKKITGLEYNEAYNLSKELEEKLQKYLSTLGYSVKTKSRVKGLRRFYEKIKEGNEVELASGDAIGIRVIVAGDAEGCYKCGEVIEESMELDGWSFLEGYYKDYIKNPRESGYRSLHYYYQKGGTKVAVQIRTEGMDVEAEREGITAEDVYMIKREMPKGRNEKLIYHIIDKIQIYLEEIRPLDLVITVRLGDGKYILTLPKGSTILDVLAHKRIDILDRYGSVERILFNKKRVILNLASKLHNYDVLEINLGKGKKPSPVEWQGVETLRAKVIQRQRATDENKILQDGMNILKDKIGYLIKRRLAKESLNIIAGILGLKDIDELYIAIGANLISEEELKDIVSWFIEIYNGYKKINTEGGYVDTQGSLIIGVLVFIGLVLISPNLSFLFDLIIGGIFVVVLISLLTVITRWLIGRYRFKNLQQEELMRKFVVQLLEADTSLSTKGVFANIPYEGEMIEVNIEKWVMENANKLPIELVVKMLLEYMGPGELIDRYNKFVSEDRIRDLGSIATYMDRIAGGLDRKEDIARVVDSELLFMATEAEKTEIIRDLQEANRKEMGFILNFGKNPIADIENKLKELKIFSEGMIINKDEIFNGDPKDTLINLRRVLSTRIENNKPWDVKIRVTPDNANTFFGIVTEKVQEMASVVLIYPVSGTERWTRLIREYANSMLTTGASEEEIAAAIGISVEKLRTILATVEEITDATQEIKRGKTAEESL